MNTDNQFISKFGDRIACTLSCFDRVIFQGHLTGLCHAGGLCRFIDNTLMMRRKDFMAWAAGQSKRIVQHAEAMAKEAGRPSVYLARRIRKDDEVHKILRNEPITEGLVCVLRCLEHSPSFAFRAGKGRPCFAPARPNGLVFYFYFLDPDLGLIHVRVPTRFPFSIQVAVNGHDYLAQQMRQRDIGFVQQDNVFTELSDPAAAQKLADHFVRENWPRRLDALAKRVLPLLADVLGKFTYHWCADQAEFATDLVFKSREQLAAIYPQLLQYASLNFSAKDILTFLGRRLHTRYDGQVLTDVRSDRAPGARVKHRAGDNWLKMYDKLALVLRVETVINQPRDFKVRRLRTRKGERQMVWCPMNKGVANLYRYRELSLASNHRYLNALTAVDPADLPVEQLHRLAEPCVTTASAASTASADAATPTARPRRHAGFNPLRADDLKLFQAVLDGDHLLKGFRNIDIRNKLFGDTDDPLLQRRRSAAVSRMLKRLHVRGLINKIPHTRRWHASHTGRQLLTAAFNTYRQCVGLPTAKAA